MGLAIAVRYALQRRAFGSRNGVEIRLLDYKSHQYRLLPYLARTYVINVALNKLKTKWHTQQLGKQLHTWSSGFKAIATWHSLEALQEAREACGGQGYKSENKIGPIKNGHDVALTYEGDNHILLQAVTKTMLGEFIKGARNGVFKGHFAYLNDRKKLNIDLEGVDMRSPTFAAIVMRRREAAVFAKLAATLAKSERMGVSRMDAFNDSAVLVEEVARAHVEVLFVDILYSSIAELKRNQEEDMAKILHICGVLSCLKVIDDSTTFVRCGAVSPIIAAKVHDAVMDICTELRPHALDLVDAFGIPPHLLAPIAFDYVKHNSRARL